MVVSRLCGFTPTPVEALPCGSRSAMSVRYPRSARAAPRFTAVVVLPTPPFWLASAITRGSGRARPPTGAAAASAAGRRWGRRPEAAACIGRDVAGWGASGRRLRPGPVGGRRAVAAGGAGGGATAGGATAGVRRAVAAAVAGVEARRDGGGAGWPTSASLLSQVNRRGSIQRATEEKDRPTERRVPDTGRIIPR